MFEQQKRKTVFLTLKKFIVNDKKYSFTFSVIFSEAASLQRTAAACHHTAHYMKNQLLLHSKTQLTANIFLLQ